MLGGVRIAAREFSDGLVDLNQLLQRAEGSQLCDKLLVLEGIQGILVLELGDEQIQELSLPDVLKIGPLLLALVVGSRQWPGGDSWNLGLRSLSYCALRHLFPSQIVGLISRPEYLSDFDSSRL